MAFLPMNSTNGSVSMPCALSRIQRRVLVVISKMAPTTPTSIDSQKNCGCPGGALRNPKSLKSGMKPALIDWNPLANGPTNWPCSMFPVSPRNINMPASVTMKAGILL